MALFGVRGSPDDSPRARRAVQRSGIASKKLSSASITTTGKASSGTVNLNRLTGERVHITGTTTITEFQLEKGEFRRLIFDDALTLTYNASLLLLPGSADIITSAGDTCEAEGVDGTIVRIISYQRGGVPPPVGATKVANVRLTLESGVPFSSTDQTAKGTFYATPCLGSYIPIYNGSSWQDVSFSEMSFARQITITGCATTNGSTTLDLTNADKTNLKLLSSNMTISGTNIFVGANLNSIAADGNSITMGSNATGTGSGLTITFSMVGVYDVFVILSGGSPALRVNSWASATSRRDGIVLLNGLYVNNGATTGNPYSPISSNLGTYIGTVEGTTISGSDGFFDSMSARTVWNYFNRRLRPMSAVEATNTWTWSTASYQIANSSLSNRLQFTRGLDEDMVFANAMSSVLSSGATSRDCRVGIGLDSQSANSATVYDGHTTNSSQRAILKASYAGYPGLGSHYLAWLEQGGGADTQTWSGDNGGTRQMGIYGLVYC